MHHHAELYENGRTLMHRYFTLTVFKMAAVRHFRFLKLIFLTVWVVKTSILNHCTQLRHNFCGGFQDGGRHHLGFSTIQNFNC